MGSASSSGEAPIGPGRLVLVVGPSGAGKDTLIALARARLEGRPDIVFPQRVVTRPASAAEDNEELTPAAFARGRARGDFALTWHAHGLDYAIPASVDTDVAADRTAVLNVSRKIIGAARARYANVAVAYIDAQPELRAGRLRARGRETTVEVAERLASAATPFEPEACDLLIRNDGAPDAAAMELYRLIVEPPSLRSAAGPRGV